MKVMVKKYLIIGGVGLVVAALIAGCFAVWQGVQNRNTIQNLNIAQSSSKSGKSTTQHPTETSPSPSNNINVGSPSSSADTFGQLGGAQTSQGTSSSSGSSSNSESQAEQELDPTTFSQYAAAKYLDATDAFYADIQTGTGATLAAGQTATVYYKGWLTNGSLFGESTDSKGNLQAFSFEYGANPSQVIAGWEEGMSGMKVGGIRMLIIPPAAGYGATGKGPIPANSVLIFAVELLSAK
jgi:FKBP-type peptidyl-prolyl cis-trans isomerase FkpA